MLINIFIFLIGAIIGGLIAFVSLKNSQNKGKKNIQNDNEDNNKKSENDKVVQLLEEEISELENQLSTVTNEYQEANLKNQEHQQQIISLKQEKSQNIQKDTAELEEAFNNIKKLQARERELSILLKNHETKEHDLINSLHMQEEENNLLKLKIEQLSNNEKTNTAPEDITINDAEVTTTKKSILVVDDSMVIRVKMEKALSQNNFNVTLATDGQDALNILAENQSFDLIITDLEMPNIDGLALVKEINTKEEIKNIPVIILTGHETVTLNTTNTNNLSGVFKKPWIEKELIDKINFLVS